MQNLDMNITNKQLPVVAFNFSELKATLEENLGYYKSLVVTEDNLSICKADQKELAGVRVKVDNYRKEVKKEMEKPIKAFEEQCKELIALVEDAEKPLKEAINVYDDKKRAEKRKDAEKIIADMIAKHKLTGEFAAELTVIDQYCNLSATYKGVYEDVEQRAFLAVQKQQAHSDMLETLQATIDSVNNNIMAKLTLSEFSYMIRTKAPMAEIVKAIHEQADRRKVAETEVKEQIMAQQPKVETPPPSAPMKQEVKATDKICFVEFRIEDTKGNIETLVDFLKGNGYKYTTLKKGWV